jgi:putative restriction endonuclease
MSKNREYYGAKFTRLNVNRKAGIPAPHKPILLLTVIEMIEQDKITDNRIELSPELIATFLKYWSNLVFTPHQSNISLPFFHLKGDKFWHLAPSTSYAGNIADIKPSLTALRNAVRYAYLDDELFEILTHPASRLYLTRVILQAWFPGNKIQLDKIYAVDELGNIQNQLLKDGGAVYTVGDLKDQDRIFVRNSAFRRVITSLYEHRCAFCKLKIVSRDNQNIVDGAHIKPFAEFRDDRFDNGLALCKNHHWAFDRGWFSINDRYEIIVADNRIHEEPPIGARSMHDFHGESIFLPTQPGNQPRLEALQWHRASWKIA